MFSKWGSIRVLSLEILLPIGVSWETISAMFKPEHENDHDSLVKSWCRAKMEELVYVGVTSAILSSLFGSALTWPAAQSTTWSTLACWYGGLVFTIASIATATQQSIMLHRFSSHPKHLEYMRHMLGYDIGGGRMAPRHLQLFIWQIPVMMLRFGVYLFLIGLCILLWHAAYNHERWSSSDCKTAVMCSVICTFALLCHSLSVFFGYSRWYSTHEERSTRHEDDA